MKGNNLIWILIVTLIVVNGVHGYNSFKGFMSKLTSSNSNSIWHRHSDHEDKHGTSTMSPTTSTEVAAADAGPTEEQTSSTTDDSIFDKLKSAAESGPEPTTTECPTTTEASAVADAGPTEEAAAADAGPTEEEPSTTSFFDKLMSAAEAGPETTTDGSSTTEVAAAAEAGPTEEAAAADAGPTEGTTEESFLDKLFGDSDTTTEVAAAAEAGPAADGEETTTEESFLDKLAAAAAGPADEPTTTMKPITTTKLAHAWKMAGKKKEGVKNFMRG